MTLQNRVFLRGANHFGGLSKIDPVRDTYKGYVHRTAYIGI
jgi:hypothetical protein